MLVNQYSIIETQNIQNKFAELMGLSENMVELFNNIFIKFHFID